MVLSFILSMNNTFSEGRILKNELPKSEREFFENDFKKSREENLDEEKQVEDESSLPKFIIKEISLKKDGGRIKPLVSHKKLDEILGEYENREINIADLRELVKRLDEEYTKKGYITTRVYLEPEQDISDGTVSLVVLLNRVESNNSRINIVPGEKQGYSKVIIESEKEKPVRLNLEYEDTQKGKRRYGIGFEYDNLLGMNDILYLNYRGDA